MHRYPIRFRRIRSFLPILLICFSACAPRTFHRIYEGSWRARGVTAAAEGDLWITLDSISKPPARSVSLLLKVDRKGNTRTVMRFQAPWGGNTIVEGLYRAEDNRLWIYGNSFFDPEIMPLPWALQLDAEGKSLDTLVLASTGLVQLRSMSQRGNGELVFAGTREWKNPGRLLIWAGEPGSEGTRWGDSLRSLRSPVKMIRTDSGYIITDRPIEPNAGLIWRTWSEKTGLHADILFPGRNLTCTAKVSGERGLFIALYEIPDIENEERCFGICRMDAQGEPEWQRWEHVNEQVTAMCFHRDGNLLSVGHRYSRNWWDMRLKKWDSETGALLWERKLGQFPSCTVVDILPAADAGYWILVNGVEPYGGACFMLYRVDEEGNWE